ncbi:hypothetical protein SDC9_187208 [bioreactor metagenome]|uniref:Uncharacterized protein n=1 Tax=bioreactor metagenome TaxID=1076179 RepID=A0A645HN59_9ZZZZ
MTAANIVQDHRPVVFIQKMQHAYFHVRLIDAKGAARIKIYLVHNSFSCLFIGFGKSSFCRIAFIVTAQRQKVFLFSDILFYPFCSSVFSLPGPQGGKKAFQKGGALLF